MSFLRNKLNNISLYKNFYLYKILKFISYYDKIQTDKEIDFHIYSIEP